MMIFESGFSTLLAFAATLLFNLLLLGLLVWLVVALIGRSSSKSGGKDSRALSILEERYARGEIPQDEFLERRSVLLGEGPGGST